MESGAMRVIGVGVALALIAGCGGSGTPGDAGSAIDARAGDAAMDAPADAGVEDASAEDGGGDGGDPIDGGGIDGGGVDAALDDGGVGDDAGSAIDASSADAGPLDAEIDAGPPSVDAGIDAGIDAGPPSIDAGTDAGIDAGPMPPPGLSEPCQNGPGWTVWRLHIDGSSSPRIDVWDASCSYSLAPGSACEARVVNFGTGTVPTVMGGYAVELGTSYPYLRVRYDVTGLSFTEAAIYVQARSYSTSASTNARIESILHGEFAVGPIDNDFVYDWYGADFTGYVLPTDDPGLTAVRIYAYGGSGSLALHAAELCVQ